MFVYRFYNQKIMEFLDYKVLILCCLYIDLTFIIKLCLFFVNLKKSNIHGKRMILYLTKKKKICYTVF